MLRFLTILFLTVFTTHLNSQSNSSNEIIAEGGAKMKIKPDLATFTLTVEKNDAIEKNVIRDLNAQTDELVKSLNRIGFSDKSIKISDYEISSSTNDNNKKRYSATSVLKVEFQLENKLIDGFYHEVQQAGTEDLDVSFDTKVSDSLEKATRLRLVQLAIEDAKSNASSIAKALEVKILRVKKVQKNAFGLFDRYKSDIVKFTPPRIIGDNEVKYKTAFDKFEVEEVELEEKINIIYEISN